MITTSLGGIFPSTVLAATSDVSIQDGKTDSRGLLGGIAVLGVISLLANHNGGQPNVDSLVKTSAATSASGVNASTAKTG